MQQILDIKIEQLTEPSGYADWLGVQYTSSVTKEHKKENGQFLTPKEISDFMGRIAAPPSSKHISILDPGCGTGILTCSLVEQLVRYDIESIELVAYEIDYKLFPYTEKSLQNLKEWLKEKGIDFGYTLFTSDFVIDMASDIEKHSETFDYIISNPPYFKLGKDDKRVQLLKHLVKGQPNIYSLFMAVSAKLLKKTGDLIFIVPRSFASGQYFNAFRDYFFNRISVDFIHLFRSRKKTFDRDKVLQETLIIKGSKQKTEKITVSTSEGIKDIEQSKTKQFNQSELIDLDSDAKILHLPTCEYEEKVMTLFKSWNNKLIDFSIQISTGPVVSFRAKQFLFDTYQNTTVFLAPLYWLHNVTKMNIEWPLPWANKSQYINITPASEKLFIPNKNYVFLRRFSSKDDKSRLVAAPYFKDNDQPDLIGVENKLNYIYKINGELTNEEIVGLAALLNSKVFDTYFRTFNGNVNVSATEIRLMPFPPIETIQQLGDCLIAKNDFSQETINSITDTWIK